MLTDAFDTPRTVLVELNQVRDTGQVNMLAIADVKIIAITLGCTNLVAFCDAVLAMPADDAAEMWLTAVLEMGEVT